MKLFLLLLFQISLFTYGQTISLIPEHFNQLAKENDDTGQLVYRATGDDPFIVMKRISDKYDHETLSVLSFEYLSLEPINGVQAFYGKNISGKRVTPRIAFPASAKWREASINFKASVKDWQPSAMFRLDLGSKSGQKFKLRNFRLREANTEEAEDLEIMKQVREQDVKRRQTIVENLNAKYLCEIKSINVSKDQIHISGSKPEGAWFELVEMPISNGPLSWQKTKEGKLLDTGKTFKFSIPRFEGSRDRLYSRWVVKANGKNDSHFHYSDNIEGARTLKKLNPSSKKGMGGISWRPEMMNDLVELGVKNITFNIVINALLSVESSKNTIEYNLNGETFYINKNLLSRYDKVMNFAKENDMIVSSIILISNKNNGRKKEIWEHPDCESGAYYSMANVNSEEGVKYYSAVLDFLAERYSREDNKFGRISNWIIHNEVDVGVVWTNAGDKLMETYTELYYRSMRIAHLTARKYDPHARVFGSFTHYWTKTVNPRYHLPKDILEMMVKMSKKEGDFEWGVAYHPYPKNLRDPIAWKDQNSNFTFNSPLITFSNIEVLDAWVKLPGNRFNGKPRGIMLSEQGMNSPDYSVESLRNQAAGFAYSWAKIKNLNSIEAFQYHRWIDEPRGEGGLMLGVWTNDYRKGKIPGIKKPIWFVFQGIDTDKEKEVMAPYKSVIGIKEWSEVEYKKAIRD